MPARNPPPVGNAEGGRLNPVGGNEDQYPPFSGFQLGAAVIAFCLIIVILLYGQQFADGKREFNLDVDGPPLAFLTVLIIGLFCFSCYTGPCSVCALSRRLVRRFRRGNEGGNGEAVRQVDVESRGSIRTGEDNSEQGSSLRTSGPSDAMSCCDSCSCAMDTCSCAMEEVVIDPSAEACRFKTISVISPVRSRIVPESIATIEEAGQSSSSADDLVPPNPPPSQSSLDNVSDISEGLSSGELRRRRLLNPDELPESSSDEEAKVGLHY